LKTAILKTAYDSYRKDLETEGTDEYVIKSHDLSAARTLLFLKTTSFNALAPNPVFDKVHQELLLRDFELRMEENVQEK